MINKHLIKKLKETSDTAGIFIEDATGDYTFIDKVIVKPDGNIYIKIQKEWEFKGGK